MTHTLRFLPELEEDVIGSYVRSEVTRAWRGIPSSILCLCWRNFTESATLLKRLGGLPAVSAKKVSIRYLLYDKNLSLALF
jgi:hypothetical protein